MQGKEKLGNSLNSDFVNVDNEHHQMHVILPSSQERTPFSNPVSKAIAEIGAALSPLSTEDRRRVWCKLFQNLNKQLIDVELIVAELSYVNVQMEFVNFVRMRSIKKNKFFVNILLFAIVLFILSFSLYIMVSFVDILPGLIFECLSAFVRVSSITIFCLVPSDQLDIFAFLVTIENRVFLCGFSFFMALLAFITAYLTYDQLQNTCRIGSLVSIVIWIPVALCNISNIMSFFNTTQTLKDTIRLSCFNALIWKMTYARFARQVKLTLVVFALSLIPKGLCGDLDDVIGSIGLYSAFFFVFILIVICLYQYLVRPPCPLEYEESHRGLREFHELLYGFCVGAAQFYVISSVAYELGGIYLSWVLLLAAVCDIFPILVVLMLGYEKSLQLIMKSVPWLNFENKIVRLQKDGLFMSTLILCCNYQSDTIWVWRGCQDKTYTEVRGTVNRQFWIKGRRGSEVKDAHGRVTAVEVFLDYRVDVDTTWQSSYSKCELCTTTHAVGLGGQSHARLSFDNWSKRFSTENQRGEVKIDEEKEQIVVLVKPSVTIRTKEELDEENKKLKEYAVKNLRKYEFDPEHWLPHDPHQLYLLSKSPREMSGDEEKEKVYNLSKLVGELKCEIDKIDFFISHSWEDKPELKREAIVKFAETFKAKKGRYPTFWFDKVCIDQKDSNLGIATLPISLNACKGVLVLMGDTYMSRLWCIWELYTVFTFRNKELIKEFVTIIPLCDNEKIMSQLKGFDIDRAHCFGPDEEVKLRFLMMKVLDQEKVTSSIKEMDLANVMTIECAAILDKGNESVDRGCEMIVRLSDADECSERGIDSV